MKALMVAMTAVLLVACGSGTPTHTPVTVVVNQDSAGKTVQAHVGDIISVELTESFPVPGSSLTWDVNTSTPSILKLKDVTRDPKERPRQGTVQYTARFDVEAGGQGMLFMRGAQTCEAMPACPQKDFTVTVDVS